MGLLPRVPLLSVPVCGPLPVQGPLQSPPQLLAPGHTLWMCLCLFPVVPLGLALGRVQVSSKEQVERSVKGERQEETWNFSSDPPTPPFPALLPLELQSLFPVLSHPHPIPVSGVPFNTAILRTSSLLSLDLHGIMSRDTDHFLLEVRPIGSEVRPA